MISIGGVIGTARYRDFTRKWWSDRSPARVHNGRYGLLLGQSFCLVRCESLTEAVVFISIHTAELSAAAVLINFWEPSAKVNNAVWITICLLVALGINLMGAGAYGEAEFIFAPLSLLTLIGRSIKVITIVGLIILGIVLDLGGGPNHDRIGFRYWKNPGPFVQWHGISGSEGQFLGWWAVMTQAAFSFIGTEITAVWIPTHPFDNEQIAAGEAKNPRKNLPKAIKRVYIRILIFYIGGTLIIGLLVPSNSSDLNLATGNAAASPFVIAIKNAGIKGLPSASPPDMLGLAVSGNAPAIFKKTNRNGLPYPAILFCALFALLAFMGINSGSGKVFGWFSAMTSVAGLMTWFGISVTYIRFYYGFKLQGYDRSTLPYASALQPYAAYYAAIASWVICLFSGWEVFLKGGWNTATFVTNYMAFALFPVLYIIWKLKTGVPIVRTKDMDFVTGLDAIEADT
ncbi:hypothetical protein HWV62_19839 [Athelia sp. TMB]|nr:hypothetical protein HWV62_19839 [Athelia sp. TMB]